MQNEVLEFGPNVVAMAKKLFEDLMNDFQVTKGSSPVGHGFYMTANFLSNLSLKVILNFTKILKALANCESNIFPLNFIGELVICKQQRPSTD